MLMFVDDALVEYEVVDDAVTVLIDFRAINALLNSATGKTWREVQKSIGTAHLRREKV